MVKPEVELPASVLALVLNGFGLLLLCLRSRVLLTAENLVLRQELALYVEPKVKPRRPAHSTRFRMLVS